MKSSPGRKKKKNGILDFLIESNFIHNTRNIVVKKSFRNWKFLKMSRGRDTCEIEEKETFSRLNAKVETASHSG